MIRRMFTLILIVMLFPFLPKAQEQPCPFQYGHFNPESEVYLFGDKVNIRREASTQSELVLQKAIGSKVSIVEQSEASYSMGGYTTNWYKVSFAEGEEVLTGYVFGGLLSLVTAELPRDAGAPDQLLYSISSWSKEKEFVSTARIVRDGKLLTSLDFPPIASGFFDASVFGHSVCVSIDGNHGFKGIKNVIRLQFIYEACGYENGEVLLLWNGDHLTYLAKASQVVEAGLFSYTYTLIFPDMEGGRANTLRIIQEFIATEADGESEKVTSHEITKKTFVWDGSLVTELPEEVEKK